jgi:hypothetical protein
MTPVQAAAAPSQGQATAPAASSSAGADGVDTLGRSCSFDVTVKDWELFENDTVQLEQEQITNPDTGQLTKRFTFNRIRNPDAASLKTALDGVGNIVGTAVAAAAKGAVTGTTGVPTVRDGSKAHPPMREAAAAPATTEPKGYPNCLQGLNPLG